MSRCKVDTRTKPNRQDRSAVERLALVAKYSVEPEALTEPLTLRGRADEKCAHTGANRAAWEAAAAAKMASVARKMVSQKKKRYQQDGFDLDLSCEIRSQPACLRSRALFASATPIRSPTLRCRAGSRAAADALAVLSTAGRPCHRWNSRQQPAQVAPIPFITRTEQTACELTPTLALFAADIPNDGRRIIAMGIPIPKRTVYGDPESPFHPLVKEIAFRNPMDEIVRFFDELHPHKEGEPLRVMVFNLCIEEDRRKYTSNPPVARDL